jgi:hypothetical protein
MDSRTVAATLAVVLVAAVVGVFSGDARAAEDGGWAETNTNLAIRPASNDPAEDRVNPSTPVMFAVMPVTKEVRSVELGDLRTGCSSSQTKAHLVIEEHRDGEPFGTPDSTRTSPSVQQLPMTAGPVKWEIPRMKLEKGVGYAFRVVPWTAQDFPTCMDARFTTWAHDRTAVVGGSRRCAQTAGGPGEKRLWHVKGDPLGAGAAAAAECGINNWNKEMPTGWLFSWRDLAAPGQRTLEIGTSSAFTTPPSGPGCVPTSSRYRWGGVWKWWYYHQTEGRHYWVCTHDDMYMPFSEQAASHSKQWHYALPWLAGRQPTTRNGGPRDMHLTLETIDYAALMTAFKPTMRYTSDENYFADSAEMMTYWEGNSLRRSENVFQPEKIADHDVDTIEPTLRLDLLGSSYQPPIPSRFNPPKEIDQLVQGGDPQDAANAMRVEGFANRAYARAVYGTSGKLWIQYWFFYYYNDWNEVSVFGKHQGDWEMIQVGLDDDLDPTRVVYSRHKYEHAARCGFDDVAVSGTTSPEVFVARGSHASYFESGSTELEELSLWGQDISVDDVHWGDREVSPQPAIEAVTGELNFLGWPGDWGIDGGSPKAPSVQQHWKDPEKFWDDADPCVTSARDRKRKHRRVAPTSTRRLPLATIHGASRDGARAIVRYSVAPTRLKEPLFVRIVVQPNDPRNPSRTEVRRLVPGRHSVRVPLPSGGGPYAVEARIADQHNRFGRKSTRALP